MSLARGDEGPVTLSVLDRLIDEAPDLTAEPRMNRAESLRRLKISLRRDLEWLLNSRQPLFPPPPGAEFLPNSTYTYGLPDLYSLPLTSLHDQRKMAQMMESIIGTFEPRLEGVRVKLVSQAGGTPQALQFVIEGMLRIDPAPELITFDTRLETANGQYLVQGGGAGA